MAANCQGVFQAVVTKMTKDGRVNLEATQRSIQRLIDNEVSGVIVLPVLGEDAFRQEREAVATTSIDARKPRKRKTQA